MKVTNENLYKKDPTNELHGALGYLSEINLQKKIMIFYIYLLRRCF